MPAWSSGAEAPLLWAVQVEDSPQLACGIENRDDQLGAGCAVAGNVVRHRMHVVDALGLKASGRRTAYPLVERNGVAGWLALERAKRQHLWRLVKIEACPVQRFDFLHDKGAGLSGVGQPIIAVEKGAELTHQKVIG